MLTTLKLHARTSPQICRHATTYLQSTRRQRDWRLLWTPEKTIDRSKTPSYNPIETQRSTPLRPPPRWRSLKEQRRVAIQDSCAKHRLDFEIDRERRKQIRRSQTLKRRPKFLKTYDASLQHQQLDRSTWPRIQTPQPPPGLPHIDDKREERKMSKRKMRGWSWEKPPAPELMRAA